MNREDAQLLVLMAVRAAAQRGLIHPRADSLDTVAIAHQLRADLGDEQLRAVCAAFRGRCKAGCNDPVSCCNVMASAVMNWAKYQSYLQKRAKREEWQETTN